MFRVLLIIALMLTAGPVAAAPPKDNPELGRLTGEGTAAFREGKYDVALERMRAARALSQTPGQLFVMARCLEELQKLEEAAEHYQGFIAAGPPPEDQRIAERRLADVQRRIKAAESFVVLRCAPANAEVTVDGHPVGRCTASVRARVAAGDRKVRVTAPLFTDWAETVRVAPGTTRDITVTLVSVTPKAADPIPIPDPVTPASSRPLGWWLLGGGGLATLAGVACVASAAALHSDLDGLDSDGDGRSDSVTMAAARSQSELANGLGIAGWSVLGVGLALVAAGGGVLLYPDASDVEVSNTLPPLPVFVATPGGALFLMDTRF